MAGVTAVSGTLPESKKAERKARAKAEMTGLEKIKAERARLGKKGFYNSKRLTGATRTSGSVEVDVSVKASELDLDMLVQAFITAAKGGPAIKGLTKKDVQLALRDATAQILSKSLSGEIEAITASYRTMIAGSLATEPNPAVSAALNQARLQARILEGTDMLDQAQACEVLGLSASNPSATMSRKEEKGEVLRFTLDGRPVYPLFQFDVAGRRIYPAMGMVLKARPNNWSDFRLMHWLTRSHQDLGAAPAEVLGKASDDVVAAFKREIEPVMHG